MFRALASEGSTFRVELMVKNKSQIPFTIKEAGFRLNPWPTREDDNDARRLPKIIAPVSPNFANKYFFFDSREFPEGIHIPSFGLKKFEAVIPNNVVRNMPDNVTAFIELTTGEKTTTFLRMDWPLSPA